MQALPLLLGIEGPSLSAEERAIFSRHQPAGYILFSRNIAQVDSCRALCEELQSISKLPHLPIIAIDQEGGRVVRTAALGLELPSAKALSTQGDEACIQGAATLCAQTLTMLGINTNFAPVLDAEKPHQNALQDRSWGKSANSITAKAGLWNRTLEAQGIKGCAKHFPGMGDANCDPHFDLPILEGDSAQLAQNATLPFTQLLPELSSMMIAHLHLKDIDAEKPASLSPILIKHILRQQLAYNGLIFTDDLCMGAIAKHYSPAQSVSLALQAGCDVPLLCHGITPMIEEVAKAIHQLPEATLNAARKRIATFAKDFRPLPPLKEDSWQQAHQACQELCKQCPEPKKDCTQEHHSPVQSY